MAFKIHLLAPLFAAGLLSTLAAAQSDTLVVSWNLKHPAWNNDEDLGPVVRIASAFDLIAFQEVPRAIRFRPALRRGHLG